MMLSCDKIRQKLDPYLNGTLDHDETERIQKHLASCEGCRLMFEEERHWIHELSTLPLIPCPERVTEAILADVESRKQSMVLPGRRKRLFGRFLWKPALVFGFLIILAFAWKGDFPRKSADYSQEEIQQAADAVKWTMMFSAKTIQQSETLAFGILNNRLPKTAHHTVR